MVPQVSLSSSGSIGSSSFPEFLWFHWFLWLLGYLEFPRLCEVGLQNSVRQGGVLSPVLFAVYLDGLLEELSESGVGCYWGHLFAGALCYADDLVLLAPCASALRCMLSICQSYADDHGLLFNATKTQLFVLFL